MKLDFRDFQVRSETLLQRSTLKPRFMDVSRQYILYSPSRGCQPSEPLARLFKMQLLRRLGSMSKLKPKKHLRLEEDSLSRMIFIESNCLFVPSFRSRHILQTVRTIFIPRRRGHLATLEKLNVVGNDHLLKMHTLSALNHRSCIVVFPVRSFSRPRLRF